MWCIGIFIMITAGMGKYAGLSVSAPSMNELMSQMPKALQHIMGLETLDISTAQGYYGVLFIYLALLASIHASMLGANIIAKEERDHTAEFLLVKPISRHKIMESKLAAAFANIIILNLITFTISVFVVQNYNKDEQVIGDIGMLMIGMFILQMIFLLIGTTAAVISKNSNKAVSMSAGILLSTFVLSVAIDLSDRIAMLKYLTPFKYFDAKELLTEGGFSTIYIVLSIGLIGGLYGATFVYYKKKDFEI